MREEKGEGREGREGGEEGELFPKVRDHEITD